MAEYDEKEPETEEERVKLWQCCVELAKRHRERFGNTGGRWTKNVKALAGDFDSEKEIGAGAVDVHMMRSSMKSSLPPLWITEPRIMVRPTVETYRGQDNVRRAENTEIELNYWMRELEVRKTAKKAIIDAWAMNHGYAYIGQTTSSEDIEVDGEVIEFNPTVRAKQPFVRRISPRMVLYPPGYDELEECPWVDIIFLKPYCDVRKKWPETTKELQPTEGYTDTAYEQDSMAGYRDFVESKDSKLVEIHNVWDKRTKKVYIFATGEKQFLEEPSEWPYKLEGFPLAELQFEYVSDEYHGTPPMSYSLTQNKELNLTRTAMSKRRRRTKSVIFMTSDAAKETKEAYAAAQDGEIIPVDTQDIRASVYVDPGLPMDAGDLAYDAVCKDDIRTSDGIGAEQRGSGDPNIDSATASANIEKHAQVRGSDRGDCVRTFYLTIARKLWMVLKSFPDREVSRLILGDRRGQFREAKYSLRDLKGEFAFELDMTAMLADNPSTRQTQAILNYNLLRADPLVNPEQLVIDIFQSQNKANPEAYLIFLRQPEQELQMAIQGLPFEAHERDDHMAHIRAHEAQGDQLLAVLERGGGQNLKVQLALALIQAHVNDHMMKLQKLQAASGKPAGSPVAENMLRNQVKAGGSGETQAELSGQPLDGSQMVS